MDATLATQGKGSDAANIEASNTLTAEQRQTNQAAKRIHEIGDLVSRFAALEQSFKALGYLLAPLFAEKYQVTNALGCRYPSMSLDEAERLLNKLRGAE